MRTIQMTLDDDLVKAVDRVSKELSTSRSAFARKALRDAIARYNLEQMERKHRTPPTQ
jgi:metal-responsive CopG/Arc/MetJ family transcriptional regulator